VAQRGRCHWPNKHVANTAGSRSCAAPQARVSALQKYTVTVFALSSIVLGPCWQPAGCRPSAAGCRLMGAMRCDGLPQLLHRADDHTQAACTRTVSLTAASGLRQDGLAVQTLQPGKMIMSCRALLGCGAAGTGCYSVVMEGSSSSSCYQSSHSINANDPAPHWSGRKREHCSRMFASITHIPSLHKIPSNMH
jgi:hypothetical protein